MFALLFVLFLSIITPNNAEIDSKIVGGVEAKPNEFPFLVSMSIDDAHFCGGSIITKRHVITAAHCVAHFTRRDLSYIEIRAGSLNHQSGGKVYYVDDIRYHFMYKKNVPGSAYDIAIVKLESQLQYDRFTQPISIMRFVPDAFEVTTSAGWGLVSSGSRTASLEQRKVDMLIISQHSCNQAWRQVKIDEKLICASAGRDAGVCDGDSGGPLIYDNKLLGIVSWGTKKCGIGKPDVFTSVPYFIDWIKRTVRL